MKCSDLIQVLTRQFAESYACDWDNVGLLAGRRDKEVQKVFIALDASDEAVQEAVAKKADLLLTHHPLIFKGVKRITDDDFTGRRLMAMIRADMSYYAMHTNFDVMGMADLAADRMGMMETVPLEVTCVEDGTAQGIGRVGNLEQEMSLAECCQKVKSVFGPENVKVFGKLEWMVRRAAICPGAGKSNVNDALCAGADVYITGDIDHHTGMDAAASGMAVIDAGHYGIEYLFIPYMAQYLREQVPELEILEQERTEPFQMV